MKAIPNVGNIVAAWEPLPYPHCSNCLHARVFGDPDDPKVHCAQQHGQGNGIISLWRLCRTKQARGFRSAQLCPDYSSMSDGE